MSGHSRLYSPSGSHTWLACTASAERNADQPRKDSVHSLRGTMLHEFCEKNFELRDPEMVDFSPLSSEDADQARVALNAAWALEDMIDDRDMTLLEHNGNVLGMEECFGTVDLVMFSRMTGHLLIADYKFGYNEVRPEMNPQLLIYALIATAKISSLGEVIEKITLAIIQPRSYLAASMFNLSFPDLCRWEQEILAPAYQAIKTGMVEFSAGEEQCRWCKSKFGCPELESTLIENIPAEQMNLLDLLKPALPVPPEAEYNAVVSKRLKAVPLLRLLADAIEEEAMRVMKEGVYVPDFKLIRGRTRRKWKDEDKAARWLAARGFKEKERYDFKVKSVAQAEKLIKDLELTPKLENSFRAMIESPPGELTYAPADDKRPGVVIDPPDLLKLLPAEPAFDDDIMNL